MNVKVKIKYLTLTFTIIGRLSHKIFDFCVAVLCASFCTFTAIIVSLLAFIQKLAISYVSLNSQMVG